MGKFDFKSVDSVLGIQTCDRRMVGSDASTEPWRQICFHNLACFSIIEFVAINMTISDSWDCLGQQAHQPGFTDRYNLQQFIS